MSQSIFYVNGAFVPASDAALPLNDLGIVRGYGVFDVLRTYNRVPFRLRDHITRLERSAQAINISLPWSTTELEEIVLRTHEQNDIANANIRIIVTGGPSANYMTPEHKPSLLVMVTPAPARIESDYEQGCTATTVEAIRERPAVKSLNYIGAIMAVEAARSAGAIEALYRTPTGFVTEGTRANLFVFRQNCLITPKDEILEGITRKVILELGRDLFDIVEAPIAYASLAEVDEAFITSTTKEVMPIVRVDAMTIGDGRPGERTQTMAEIFHRYTHEPVHI